MLLLLAIIMMVIAHLLKVYRTKQFIKIYEKPDNKSLIQALSLGYIINFFVPFRIGDLFRSWYAGRKMQNGQSFSLAIVIIDRILDIFAVSIIFVLFYLLGIQNNGIEKQIIFYTLFGLILFLIMLFGLKYNKIIKISIKKIASIFNNNIELKILKFSWFMITSLKDLIKNLNKVKLVLITIIMWTMYLTSYTLFAYFLKSIGKDISLIEIFTLLFSKNNLEVSTLNMSKLNINSIYLIIYLVVPLIILIIISLLPIYKKQKAHENENYLKLLPHINPNDKLNFLEGYFSAKSREYFKNYIKINRDISIIQDFTAGSNATTMLCTDGVKTFFRKYSFGKDNEKLYEQVLWLKKHSKDLPLTDIINVKKGEGYCSYDMPYIKEAISCFNYVHSVPISKGWETIYNVLEELNNNLYKKSKKKNSEELLDNYIDNKITKNLNKIKNGSYIKPLLKYDYLIINGIKYHNLTYFDKYLDKEYLKKIFKKDECAEIHGDLTIENIICITGKNKNNFYIIDPNTGNVHDSPNLDYAKLLQSLHGGYEFLMNTKNIEIHNNQIDFLFTKSLIYDELFLKYKQYLYDKFDKNKVKSIFYHEIVHWLRLMPYKIEKNGERSVLFYAGLIKVLNDVIKEFEKNEKTSNF